VRRLPVWTALADTFLDTQLEPADYSRIAAVIREAGYDTREAEAIYREDVVPAFAGNLLSVTGEWSGWSQPFVRVRVLARRRSRIGRAAYRLLLGQHIAAEWARVRKALEKRAR